MSRVWLISETHSSLGIVLTRAALAAGDAVVALTSDAIQLRRALDDSSGSAGDFLPLEVDTTDPWQVVGAVEKSIARFGGIDILVNNAQTAHLGYFEELRAEDFGNALSAHTLATVHVTQAVLPYMRAQRHCQVINIGASSAQTAAPYCAAVNAAGFAVEGLSRSLAEEVRGFGLFVTCIKPQLPMAFHDAVHWAERQITDYLDDRAYPIPKPTGDEPSGTEAVALMWAIKALFLMSEPPVLFCIPPTGEWIDNRRPPSPGAGPDDTPNPEKSRCDECAAV